MYKDCFKIMDINKANIDIIKVLTTNDPLKTYRGISRYSKRGYLNYHRIKFCVRKVKKCCYKVFKIYVRHSGNEYRVATLFKIVHNCYMNQHIKFFNTLLNLRGFYILPWHPLGYIMAGFYLVMGVYPHPFIFLLLHAST